MTRTAVERRLAEIERQIAAISPQPEPGADQAWISWTTDSELDEFEAFCSGRHTEDGTEPSDAEQLRALAIYATATARMIKGARP